MRIYLIGLFGILSTLSYAQKYSFQWLENLPGTAGTSRAYAISDNGDVVTGASWKNTGPQAVIWDSNGVTSLGDLANFVDDSGSYGLNSDGSVIVGATRSSIGRESFIFQNNEMIGLGFLGEGSIMYSYANDISDNGMVIGQSVDINGYHAFYFENELLPLPHFEGPYSMAISTTKNGEYIVGASSNLMGTLYAVRWINKSGPYRLGPDISSVANAISENEHIVGRANFDDRPEAFLWTTQNGMQRLGNFGGEIGSTAWAVTSDGAKIVGNGSVESREEAFIWDQENGMRSLQQILENNCVVLEGVNYLYSARGISADGAYIIGNGVDLNGKVRAYKIHLPIHEIPTDVNDDGLVDLNDLTIFVSAFGSCIGDLEFNPDCDTDCDSCITIRDLSEILGNFGITS